MPDSFAQPLQKPPRSWVAAVAFTAVVLVASLAGGAVSAAPWREASSAVAGAAALALVVMCRRHRAAADAAQRAVAENRRLAAKFQRREGELRALLGRTWGVGLRARRRTAVLAARRGRCRAWSGAAEMAWAQIRGSGVAVCAVAVGGAGVGGGKSCRG
jgi:hypothetical protein